MQKYYVLYIDSIGAIDCLKVGTLEIAEYWMEWMREKNHTAIVFRWNSSVLTSINKLIELHNERQ